MLSRILRPSRVIGLVAATALSSHGITVNVTPGVPPSSVTFADGNRLPPLTRTAHVGFFNTGADPFLFDALLHGGQAGLTQLMFEYFVPLGEPDALFWDIHGANPFPYGLTSSVLLRELSPGGSVAPIGMIQNVFLDGGSPPDTLSASGIPLNTRLYLVISDPVPDFPVFFGEIGIFSATTWVTGPTALTNESLQLSQVDTPEEVFYGSLAPGGMLRLAAVIPEHGANLLSGGAVALLATMRRRAR